MPQLGVFQRRTGGRIALVAEANVYGRTLVIYNLHLESKGNDALRLRQLEEVLNDRRQYGNRSLCVIGGDFNLNAGNGEAARALRDAGFHDAVRCVRASDDARPRTVPPRGRNRLDIRFRWLGFAGRASAQ